MIEITDDMFVETLKRLSQTDDGKIFLAYICKKISWADTPPCIDIATFNYEQGKKEIYSQIRQYIEAPVLKQIEHDYTIKQKERADNGTSGRKLTNRNTNRK